MGTVPDAAAVDGAEEVVWGCFFFFFPFGCGLAGVRCVARVVTEEERAKAEHARVEEAGWCLKIKDRGGRGVRMPCHAV